MIEYVRNTAQDLTSIQVPESARVDMLFRVTANRASETINVRFANTNDVAAYFQRQMSEKTLQINTLSSVIRWQHELLDYNSHYNAFLLGQVEEDEFATIAEQFAYEPSNIEAIELAPEIERIYSLTKIPYTPSELASLFKCHQENILSALGTVAIQHPEFSAMLPDVR